MSQFGIPEPGNDKREPQRGERPKLQFQVRRTGPVPIPPDQIESDYELLERAMARRYQIVADLAFTLLLRRIKAGPMYLDKTGKGYFARLFHTIAYVQSLPKP